MSVINRNKITTQTCRDHPEKIFVYGDNLIGRGKAGQACIRDEPNSFGLPTKRLPSMTEGSFFSDRQDEDDIVMNKLRELHLISQTKQVVFPFELGTGLSKMPEKSPNIYAKIIKILELYFNR